MKNKVSISSKIFFSVLRRIIKFLIIFSIVIVVLGVTINTRVFLNSWSLLNDPANYIPSNSSIFTFEPTKIDSGSGGYWRYGEDYKNYYYFSVDEKKTYFYTPKDMDCLGFDKFNYLTWCKYKKVSNVR